MSAFRRGGGKRRRDANERAICDALQAVGATTLRISGVGLPDLLVGYRGRWTPLEVKTATGTRTAAQVKSGAGELWQIVRSVEDALQAIGVTK